MFRSFKAMSDSGTKFTSPQLCEPFTHTVNPVLFAHVNGKQPESQVRRVLGEKAQQCTIINFDSLPWRCQTTESGVTCEVVHTMDTLLGNMTVTHLLMLLFLSLRYHSSCLSDFPTE